LFHPAFAFKPVFCSAGAIGSIEALRDNAFELKIAGMGEYFFTLTVQVIGIKQRAF
jgi:hypothetical protein